MRACVLAVLLAVGCKDKDKPKQTPSSGSAAVRVDAGAVPPIDWAKCDQALANAAAPHTPVERVNELINGCQPCGDPMVLLAWNTLAQERGPKREQIEQAMVACNAFCTGDAKLKFMSALDKARGMPSRAPWRQLAQSCKERFPGDGRYVSAPYLLLDQIARLAVARGGDTAKHLAEIELPLPPLTVSGEGPALADEDEGVAGYSGDVLITMLGEAIYVASAPHARLTATGIEVMLGPTGYPGEQVTITKLGDALKKLKGRRITLIAPQAMPAKTLVPVIAAASKIGPLFLAVNSRRPVLGWPLASDIEVALEASGKNPIVVTGDMTVAKLANELGERASQGQAKVGIKAK